MRTFCGPLFRYCYGQLHDHHLAEDATQEALLRAFRLMKNTKPKDTEAWLFGITRRCCQEIQRRRRRPAEQPGSLKDLAAPPPASDPLSAELESALDMLSDAERGLIYLKHAQGLTCREIAELEGKPLGTVTGTLARAYERLRSRLQAEGR